MSDLRESGSIEQDADIVSFLYRDDYYKSELRRNDNSSITELIIGKHRNGPTATIELMFKMNTSTFVNLRNEEKTTLYPFSSPYARWLQENGKCKLHLSANYLLATV